ncbi:unnamed protein product, partial [Prorocentrum cordatum]
AEEARCASEEAERAAAATRIQAACRGRLVRRGRAAEAEEAWRAAEAERAAAAARIQVEEAKRRAEDAERAVAAVRIQASYRGRSVRRGQAAEVAEAKRRAEEAERAAAAVRIQASYRGRSVRQSRAAEAARAGLGRLGLVRFIHSVAMQGCASNFDELAADFERRLPEAQLVACDMELSGVRLEGCADSDSETATERTVKYSRIAEKYAPLEIGFTMVVRGTCVTYNFLTRPRDDYDKDDGALRFLREKRGLDLDESKCIQHGVPYNNSEEEASARPGGGGLLRLWRALCGARVPLVVHSPLDVFFLLACFEQPRLSLLTPRELAALLRRRLPAGVYDTAHLFDAIPGGPKGLSVQEGFGRLWATGGALDRTAETKAAYGDWAAHGSCSKEHEAGYDSLLTAQLFSDLASIAPEKVKEGRNRMYLHMSPNLLDFNGRDGAGNGGEAREGDRAEPEPVAAVADRLLRGLLTRPAEHCGSSGSASTRSGSPEPAEARQQPSRKAGPQPDSPEGRDGNGFSDDDWTSTEQAAPSPWEHGAAPGGPARALSQGARPPPVGSRPGPTAECPPDADELRALHEAALRQFLSDDEPPDAGTEAVASAAPPEPEAEVSELPRAPSEAAPEPDAARAGRLLRGLLRAGGGPGSASTRSGSPEQAAPPPGAACSRRSCGSPASASTRCSSPGQAGGHRRCCALRHPME